MDNTNKLSFKYCPICAGELDGHPVKSPLRTCNKEFIIQKLGKKNPAGYCKECKKIFAEFEVIE